MPAREHMNIPYSEDDDAIAAQLLEIFGVTEDEGVTAEEIEDYRVHLAENIGFVRKYATAASRLTEPGPNGEAPERVELWELMDWFGYFWLTRVTVMELPSGPFPEPEVGGRPAAGSGADFIYIAFCAIGVQFADDEFREHFMIMREHVRVDHGGGLHPDSEEAE